MRLAAELLAEIVAGINEGAAGVLFLAIAVEIGSEAELRLHLFFAVTEIVVRDEGDHYAGRVAGSELEGGAVVVFLVRIAPAHAVLPLAFGRVFVGRQAEFLFGDVDQVGREDDAAGVAAPMI